MYGTEPAYPTTLSGSNAGMSARHKVAASVLTSSYLVRLGRLEDFNDQEMEATCRHAFKLADMFLRIGRETSPTKFYRAEPPVSLDDANEDQER